jgi:hypothetical protein
MSLRQRVSRGHFSVWPLFVWSHSWEHGSMPCSTERVFSWPADIRRN